MNEMAKYEVERFESPPDPDLVCCICQCVLHNPLESPCQHVFCQICIETWLTNRKNCPNCRKNLRPSKLKPVLPIVRNMINRLLIKCDNRGRGCRERIKLEYYEKHTKECGFISLQCMNAGCEVTVLRRDMLHHEGQCKYRLVVCKRGCGMPIAAEQEPNHNCIVILKNNIRELEETYDKRFKQLTEGYNKLQEKVKELEERVAEALPAGNEDEYYSDSYSVGDGEGSAHGDEVEREDGYSTPFGTPDYQSDYTPTSGVLDLEDPLQSDGYSDGGRDTPINRDDQDSTWSSWLNEDDNGDSQSGNGDSGSGDADENGVGYIDEDSDGQDWSEAEGQSTDGEDQSSSGHHQPSQSHREASSEERPHSYSLRSTHEAGEPPPQAGASSSGATQASGESHRRRDRPADSASQRGSAAVPTGGTAGNSAEADTTSQPVWFSILTPRATRQGVTAAPAAPAAAAPSSTGRSRGASEGNQREASETTHRGASEGTNRGASEANHSGRSERTSRSATREDRHRHRSSHRRRSRDDYSSDEDRDHRGSRHSSSKRSRRR